MELYYAIINILDYMALHEIDSNLQSYFYTTLTNLHHFTDIGTIQDIADANNCGICNNWAELVKAFKKQHGTRERF